MNRKIQTNLGYFYFWKTHKSYKEVNGYASEEQGERGNRCGRGGIVSRRCRSTVTGGHRSLPWVRLGACGELRHAGGRCGRRTLKRLRNWNTSGLKRSSELKAGSPGERTHMERFAPGRFAGARTQHSEWGQVHCSLPQMRTVKHFREVLD